MNSPCYGTLVHPGGGDLAGLLAMLEGPAVAVREALGGPEPLGLGLWLPAAAARAIAGSEDAAAMVRDRLARGGLRIDTVNAFPAGGFHGERVKERVYVPDWSEPARLEYSVDVARALARLLPPGSTCVASTVPGGWKARRDEPAQRRALARGLVEAARDLASIADATGVRTVLAPEPEPGCSLETTAEASAFWRMDLALALGAEAGRLLPHLGLCVDLCHLAVAGEDPAESLARLRREGIPVVKVQASAALEIARPAEDATAVEALRRFDEPRWLHQASGRTRLGGWRRALDLPEVFDGIDAWRTFAPWRVHFHAPLHEAKVGGVATTRDLVPPALWEVRGWERPPVVEVETYTWSALPGFTGSAADLARGIASEIRFAKAALESAPA